MPLPQQVINQLGHDADVAPGWSSGLLVFASGVLAVTVGIYLFQLFVYTPYLNSSLANIQGQVAKLDQSISSSDEVQLVTFYSQIVNLQSTLRNHILFSQLLDWLSNNTEANIYYSQFSFSSGNQISLAGVARSESDINQQVAIFESSPYVQKVAISGISFSATTGLMSFSATLVVNPSILQAPAAEAQAAATTQVSTTTKS
jgi:hypothetical protein